MKEKFRRPWQAAWDKRKLRTISTKLTLKQAAEACTMPVGTFYGKARKFENVT